MPSGSFTSGFEAVGFGGVVEHVESHMFDEGHILGAMAGSQAREIVMEDDI